MGNSPIKPIIAAMMAQAMISGIHSNTRIEGRSLTHAIVDDPAIRAGRAPRKKGEWGNGTCRCGKEFVRKDHKHSYCSKRCKADMAAQRVQDREERYEKYFETK